MRRLLVLLLVIFGFAARASQPPVANPGGPYSAVVGQAITFDGSRSSVTTGTIKSYRWTFGDGASGSGVAPSHTYASAGSYLVTLIVADNRGIASAPASTTATISDPPPPPPPPPNQPPVANAGGPYSGTVNQAMVVSGAGSSDPDGSIVSYQWDCGDGSMVTTLTSPSFTCTYAAVGTYTLTLTVTDNQGATASARASATISDVTPPSGSSALSIDHLRFIGQAVAEGTLYSNPALAIRYVNGERRFLAFQFSSATYTGDLIEYALTQPLTNGTSDWTLDTVPAWTERRRWTNWSTRARLLAVPQYQAVFAGAPTEPGSFYWDEAQGVLWYAFERGYGADAWPCYGATRLADDEAIVAGDSTTVGRTVSDANIYGPWFFQTTCTDCPEVNNYKSATAGIIPIPLNRQAAMGGKYLLVGHHAAVISTTGPRGASFWVASDLPNLVTPPARWSAIFSDAVHIYDTAPTSGITPYSMHIPNNHYQALLHASTNTGWWQAAGGGSLVPLSGGGSVGTTAGDAIYADPELADPADTLWVVMDQPASGGSWQPELFDGTNWNAPTGWKMAAGAADLSGPENVFYWPKVPYAHADPVGNGSNWIRLRRVTAGTSGGHATGVFNSSSTDATHTSLDRPDPVGGYDPAGRYDATHYGFSYENMFWGGAWVQTATVEGLAYFGVLGMYGQWYGAAPAWAQPFGGGVARKVVSAIKNDPSNGGKVEGPMSAFYFPFDVGQLLQTVTDPTKRNANFLNPIAFTELHSQFPGLIVDQRTANPDSPYVGQPDHPIYGWGHSVVYDVLTQQLIVLLTDGQVYGTPILAVWQVQ